MKNKEIKKMEKITEKQTNFIKTLLETNKENLIWDIEHRFETRKKEKYQFAIDFFTSMIDDYHNLISSKIIDCSKQFASQIIDLLKSEKALSSMAAWMLYKSPESFNEIEDIENIKQIIEKQKIFSDLLGFGRSIVDTVKSTSFKKYGRSVGLID
jgi:hypothetical protein